MAVATQAEQVVTLRFLQAVQLLRVGEESLQLREASQVGVELGDDGIDLGVEQVVDTVQVGVILGRELEKAASGLDFPSIDLESLTQQESTSFHVCVTTGQVSLLCER